MTRHVNYIADDSNIIDSTRMGNDTRYANHSCAPNAELVTLLDPSGINRMFMSIKPIRNGEEITWDYDEVVDSPPELLSCRCYADGCRLKLNRMETKEERRKLKKAIDVRVARNKFDEEVKEEVRNKFIVEN